jgi:ABC-2 type transport system ATP-binding protein
VTAAESVLRIERLVKDYGPIPAVRGIDLEIRRGEVFGFLGPNGAGKSTTIRCLLGLLRPTSGAVSAFGLDAIRDGVALRRRVAYVPGELHLPDRISAHDFVASIGRLRGGFDTRRRDELAERLRLDLRRQLRELSTGNRRKVALLLAFLADAELLVLDEPTNGLDPLMQHEFLGLVREARAGGATVFLSSHVLSEVQQAADRVAVLRAGKIVALGTVPDLRGQARQRIEVWFEDEPPMSDLQRLPGIAEPMLDDHRFTAVLAGSIQPVLNVLARHRVSSMVIEEPNLEDAFLELYSGDPP